ncbi:MAG: UDP-glucose/GDP-mannose dehydrogenase family protein [Gammaproteobacteria bacterium]|nr:UDP-glucose/GDP-mannose dehydrogenase family protein [Gammaproteobacteria bacterium]
MNVTVFGSGYVGLVTGACLAESGNKVVCVDIDDEKISVLKRGQIPIYEPGLQEIVRRNLESGRLSFTTNAREGVEHGLFQFIAVGTPAGDDGSADYSHVVSVARSIGQYMNEYKVVVDKSTVPVGTADLVKKQIQAVLKERGVTLEFDVASNPEFLKEGAAVTDFMRPDRIIIGTDNPRTAELFHTLYNPYTRNRDRLLVMDVRSAELTKYAANAMLATKISFMNELALLAEKLGADIENVRLGIGADPRIGFHFIYPGCGFGGSCFPKDIRALIGTADKVGNDLQLLRAVRDVNNRQKMVLFKKISRYFSDDLRGKTIAVWGLAFKPNTNDMREAPSIVLIKELCAAGAHVKAYDPVANAAAKTEFRDIDTIQFSDTAMDAIESVDALVLVTEWTEFRSPDFEAMAKTMKNPVIFDGRNVYDPGQMIKEGFHYVAIGRGETVE